MAEVAVGSFISPRQIFTSAAGFLFTPKTFVIKSSGEQLSELERVFERKGGARRCEPCGKDFSVEKYFCTIVLAYLLTQPHLPYKVFVVWLGVTTTKSLGGAKMRV